MGVCEKKRVPSKEHFSHYKHYLAYPSGGDVQKCVPNLVFKFYNGPTVNESGIVVLLRHVWVYARKREGFERERRKNRFERGEKRVCEKLPNMSLSI